MEAVDPTSLTLKVEGVTTISLSMTPSKEHGMRIRDRSRVSNHLTRESIMLAMYLAVF
jgi:hypothetical protein